MVIMEVVYWWCSVVLPARWCGSGGVSRRDMAFCECAVDQWTGIDLRLSSCNDDGCMAGLSGCVSAFRRSDNSRSVSETRMEIPRFLFPLFV